MENHYLFTVLYKDVYLWDVKRYSRNAIRSNFKIDYLGEHIKSENRKIVLSDYPDKIFNILGISNEIGMFDAYSEQGKNFNQAYKMVGNGFIAYNPYRVNVGSIGIKTDNLKGDLISPAYVVFSCKETLLPEYLFLLMKTDKFNEYVKENTSGSVRQNLTFDALSNIKIPVPSIEEQNQIVKKYEDDLRQLEKSEGEYWDNFNKLFVEKLEAFDFEIEENNGYYFGEIALSSLDRWDCWVKSIGLKSKKYKVVSFESIVLEKPQYGANVKGVNTDCGYRYIRITDINEDGSLNSDVKYPESVDEKFILKENDFLIARSGNTVGKTFLYKENVGSAIYAGYLVKYVLNSNLVVPEYVLYFTKSVLFKNWILRNQRIAGQPNINGQEYLSAPIILPPIEVQKEIVKEAENIINLMRESKKNIEYIETKAKKDFEDAIFES